MDFKKEAQLIARAAGRLQDRIQKYLVAVVRDWCQTGDVRPVADRVNWLVEGLGGSGVRANAVRAWAEAHLGVIWNPEAKAFERPVAKKIDREQAEEACATKWWEFRPEPEYKPLILSEGLEALLKKARKRAENPNEQDKVPAEGLKILEKALKEIEALEAS